MLRFNENKVIKRSDLWVHMDSELYTMLCNGIHISCFDNYEEEKKQHHDLARKLFYENKLILKDHIIASQKRSDLEWAEDYFFNVRIKVGFINTKRFYFLDYAGNYEIHKAYHKIKGNNPNNEKYIIHVSNYLNDKETFFKNLKEYASVTRYYIKGLKDL